jgi:Replication initiator protein A
MRGNCTVVSWINEWKERAGAHGHANGIDLIVPDSFYKAVLSDARPPTIDREHFKLRGAWSAGFIMSNASTRVEST